MLSDCPPQNVVEVSIFGPGKGESVLVHLGNKRWIIVDSCIDQRTSEVSALSYLNRIGVDPAEAVLLVVATHAHDDHFAGIAEVFRRCSNSQFVCSDALTTEEFFALTNADERMATGLRAHAFSEYREVFKLVRGRSAKGPGFRPLKYAVELRPLLESPDGTRVLALSPSDEAISRARIALRSAIPTPGSSRRPIRIDPNELAVALWIEAQGKSLLLGADLLAGPGGCGWMAVLAAFTPVNRASLFKVPHHGSVTGHHDDVWKELLQPAPLALLAPFRAGKRPLPDPDDRTRILTLTSEAFITASPRMPPVSKAVKREAAALGPIARRPREPWGTAGHVRARCAEGEDVWNVEMWPPAQRLVFV